ncbi:MAG: DUF2306 domain-containing protein [Opitutaceae bacterium]|nr:DUF2306 domain-containing protein [Opitutaceae bacterium]
MSLSSIFLLLAVLTLLGVAAHFWWDNALAYFANYNETGYRRYWPNRIWLIAHIAGGTLALALGPIQFWSGFKLRWPRAHRLLGYAYALGILAGGGAAFVLAVRARLPDFGFSLFFLGVAWWVTLGMALVAIRNRRFDAHRDWMIRSYIVTFGFVTFRYVVELELLNGLGRSKYAAIGWACWVLPLLFAEIFLHWRNVAPRKREVAA